MGSVPPTGACSERKDAPPNSTPIESRTRLGGLLKHSNGGLHTLSGFVQHSLDCSFALACACVQTVRMFHWECHYVYERPAASLSFGNLMLKSDRSAVKKVESVRKQS